MKVRGRVESGEEGGGDREKKGTEIDIEAGEEMIKSGWGW